MKKKIFLIFAFLLLIMSVSLIIFVVKNNPEENKVCFKDICFYVELAETQKERTQGLMFRESLDLNKGMLFIFEEEGEPSFWMKNTLIPLDIIWISKDKEVVFAERNVQPCTRENCEMISPDRKAKYVLEINAGITDKIDLKIGDRLVFDTDKDF